MNFADFKMHQLFTTAGGNYLWLVTDIGTRVIVAVRIFTDPPSMTEAETVFDRDDFAGCQPL